MRSRAEDLALATSNDVLSWGWSGEQLLARLIEIDHQHIEGMDETDEGSVRQWSPVFMEHPCTWSLLVVPRLVPSPEAIAGYWSFCTVQPHLYNRALAGSLHDSEITPANLRRIDGPGEYDAYFVMFVIAHAHRRAGAVKLVRSFFDNLLALAGHGVFLRRICTNAFTQEGSRLAGIIRLEPQVAHAKRGHIYARAIEPSGEEPFPSVYAELNHLYLTRSTATPGVALCSAA